MLNIKVIKGIRYTPEKLTAAIGKNKRLAHIECTPVNILYSPCWIFAFHVAFELTKKHTRHVGFWGGVDEIKATPGLIRELPEWEETQAAEINVLPDKMSEEEAADLAWNYNKRWVARKHRMLIFGPPIRTRTDTYKLYKPVYMLKFYNRDLDQTLFKALDSLTGELENIVVKDIPGPMPIPAVKSQAGQSAAGTVSL